MYFIYDGNEAKFLTETTENVYEVGKVNWRDTNIQVILISTLPFNINKTKHENNSLVSLLKSNLQKQIRRKEINAVATCELLLDVNTFECLRRLSIIAAEDVEISKETSVIVWLMAAVSKGYVMSKRDKNFVLIYVGNLTNHNLCRRLENQDLNIGLIDINDILSSNHPDKEYIAGIFFRIAYGGLSGDLPMLNKLCSYALSKDKLLSFKGNLLIKAEFKINNAAVDFHVYPNLCNEIYQDTEIDPDIIKELIWTYSSGINLRCKYDLNNGQNIDQSWLKIEKSFCIRSKEYLQKIIKQYFK